ncbi:MAG: fumarate reductase subunit FrdD [Myxococcota bacterium]|nr:fumarate reductase subunit FrdD [Myxococcota bacterium]
MKELLLRIEPVIWLLFGQGILIGTILLTGWILVVGILIPLGLVAPEALDYSRAYALAANPLGQIVLLALIALPLWKGAHHLRHLAIDHGGANRDAIVAPLLYGVAAVGSVMAIVAVIRL